MKEKNNNIFVVIIVILSILLIISIGYTIYDKIESSKTQDEEIKMLTKQEAEELFGKIVKDPIIENVVFDNKSGELKVSDMDNNQLGAIIYANMGGSGKKEICNTELEDNLINLGIISKIDEGQYDCKIIDIYEFDKVKEVAKSLFGKNYNLVINQSSINDSFYYYDEGNMAIFRYPGASYEDYIELKDYKLENDTAVLNIETNFPAGEGYEKDNYKLRFKLDDDNYYFYSIEKLD